MAIQYSIYQNTRKGGNLLFYGRAVHPQTIDFKKVCERVQANCSAKESDVKLVLTEYIEQMKQYLVNGYKVKWEGIGTFRVGASSMPAIEPNKLRVDTHIKYPKLLFLAEATRVGGAVTRAFQNELQFKKASGSEK